MKCWNCQEELGIKETDYGDHLCKSCGVMNSILDPNTPKLEKEDKPKTSFEDWQDKKEQATKGEKKMKDLCVRETYTKNGEEKTSWNKIGILFESNDKQYVKLFHIPGVLISVFEQKPKEKSGEAF